MILHFFRMDDGKFGKFYKLSYIMNALYADHFVFINTLYVHIQPRPYCIKGLIGAPAFNRLLLAKQV